MDIEPLKFIAGIVYLILTSIFLVATIKHMLGIRSFEFRQVAASIGFMLNVGVSVALILNSVYPLPSDVPQEIVLFNFLVPFSFAFVMYLAKLYAWQRLKLI